MRDAGFEVIYTGLFQTPEMVAEAVLQEDADAVGLSVLSGAHMTLFPRVITELGTRGLDDVVVFGGGIVPPGDVAALTDGRRRRHLHARFVDGRDHRLARADPRRPGDRRDIWVAVPARAWISVQIS